MGREGDGPAELWDSSGPISTKALDAVSDVEEGGRRGMVGEVLALLMGTLSEFDPETTSTLAGSERFVRCALHRLGGILTSRLAVQADADCTRPQCSICPWVRRSGSWVPIASSPELSRVVAAPRAEVPSLEQVAALLGDVLGIAITPDTAGRDSGAIGEVAEQEMQRAMASPIPSALETKEEPLVLMVEINVCKTRAGKRWRDFKVAAVALPWAREAGGHEDGPGIIGPGTAYLRRWH